MVHFDKKKKENLVFIEVVYLIFNYIYIKFNYFGDTADMVNSCHSNTIPNCLSKVL